VSVEALASPTYIDTPRVSLSSDGPSDAGIVSLRCLAYALPLGLLSWAFIFLCIAVGTGYVNF
jgi:hypothetical protein